MLKNFDDLQKLGKDNMDTALKQFGAFSRSFQAIATEVADYSKKSFEEGAAAAERQKQKQSLRGKQRPTKSQQPETAARPAPAEPAHAAAAVRRIRARSLMYMQAVNDRLHHKSPLARERERGRVLGVHSARPPVFAV